MLEREGNIIYEIDENTVIARYVDTWDIMLSEEMYKLFSTHTIAFLIPYYFIHSRQYKQCGIAKCSPNDEFDKQFGKKLARERLVTKYNRMRFMYFKEVGKSVKEVHKILVDKSLKYYKASIYKKEG